MAASGRESLLHCLAISMNKIDDIVGLSAALTCKHNSPTWIQRNAISLGQESTIDGYTMSAFYNFTSVKFGGESLL